MTAYLVDTNVVSETMKPRGATVVLEWVRTHHDDLYLSVLTLGELRRGAIAAARRGSALAGTLANSVTAIERDFTDRILDVDREVVRAWAELPTLRTLPAIDSLLAATAGVHGLTFVTRNTRDIADLGVPFINPWEA